MNKKAGLITMILGVGLLPLAAGADPVDDLRKTVESQQQTIDSLKQQMDATANLIENGGLERSAASATPDTVVGGYGEINYNHYTDDSSRDMMDLRRFVLSVAHRFSDRLFFNGEIEWEHAIASAEDQGETEIEQAYLSYSLRPELTLTAGLFLMPFGFLNESHEPPNFYGVERNFVETLIIPSTWREGGVQLRGTTAVGIAWEAGVTTGFDIAHFDDASAPLAASHQELQMAKARDLSVYGALNYRGVPGLTVGSAVFTGNAAQGNADYTADNSLPDFAGADARVTLWDLHARWQPGLWDLQTVYARGSIGDAAQIDQVLQTYNAANGTALPYVPEAFYGWYGQVAYVLWRHENMSFAPFVRYEKYDAQSRMPAGFSADAANADRVTTVGFSFKPHPQVVVKADYQTFQDNSGNDRYDLGIGYQF